MSKIKTTLIAKHKKENSTSIKFRKH